MSSPRRTTRHRLPLLASGVAFALALTACTPAVEPGGASTPTDGVLGDGHGAVAGAAEMPEPQPHLVTVGGDGTVSALDLLDESSATLGRIDGVTAVSTDGRFVFAASAGSGELTIVDSGVWTWDHEDHFHYYRGEARVVGTLRGAGEAVVSPGPTLTGVFFPASGDAVLLDTHALADGEIVETTRYAILAAEMAR